MMFNVPVETEPESGGAVRALVTDMGNGVVRIDLCHQSTIADAQAFARRDDVVAIDGIEREKMCQVMSMALDTAPVEPFRLNAVARSISDRERETFFWYM